MPRTAPGRALPVVQGLLCGIFAAAATPTALLAAALLTPSIGIWLLEREPGRPVARCMALCGMAAAAFPLATLWGTGHRLETTLALLADPATVALAWAAQGGGWLLAEMLPLLLSAVSTLQAAARVRALQAARTRLEEEWGIPPANPETPTGAMPSGTAPVQT